VAQALVVEVGAEPVVVAEADRALYHAALSHGSNHLVTLVAQAAEALRAAGLEQTDRVLGPLLHAALDSALRAGDDALTGPVARGDAGTLAAHRAVLAAAAADGAVGDDLPATHLALARATAGRARAQGRLGPAAADAVDAALADGTAPDHPGHPDHPDHPDHPETGDTP